MPTTSAPTRYTTRKLSNLNLTPTAKLLCEAPVNFMRPIVFKKTTKIGAFTFMNNGFVDHCREIGRYCSIGQDLRIGEPNHPLDWLSTSTFQYNAGRFGWHEAADDYEVIDPKIRGNHFSGDAVTIGNDVWIGSGVTILRGVTVGDGAVLAAGSIVTKDVEPYMIVGGNPAKNIRSRFSDGIVAMLLDLKWWEYSPNDLSGTNFSDIDEALAMVGRLREIEHPIYKPTVEVITKPRLEELGVKVERNMLLGS